MIKIYYFVKKIFYGQSKLSVLKKSKIFRFFFFFRSILASQIFLLTRTKMSSNKIPSLHDFPPEMYATSKARSTFPTRKSMYKKKKKIQIIVKPLHCSALLGISNNSTTQPKIHFTRRVGRHPRALSRARHFSRPLRHFTTIIPLTRSRFYRGVIFSLRDATFACPS